jgi:DNA mismatch repair ATPase MutS
MDDARALLRDATPHTLACLDELGRGTSSADGSALMGALLEALDARGPTVVFATHLHEILRLPGLDLPRVRYRRMGLARERDAPGDGGGDGAAGEAAWRVRWTYQLEEGVCLDSMAAVTARAAGVPEARHTGDRRFVPCGGVFD